MRMEEMMMKEGSMGEDVGIIGGLVVIQFVYAAHAVLLSYLMSLGLRSLTIVIFTSISTSLVLFPIAFSFERYVLLYLSPLNSLE